MLEVIGLFLAASDFAGWTPKIEAALDLLARSLWRLVEGLNASHDPEKQKPFSPAVERLVTYVVISLVGLIMIALQIFSLSMGPPPPLQDISHAIRSIVGFLLALVFAFFFALLMLFLAFNFLVWLVLVPLALLFRILNLAPRGIVTAIGLMTAAAGVIERFYSS